MPTRLPINITTYTFIVISLGSKTDAHTVLYDHLTNAMLALFDQSSVVSESWLQQLLDNFLTLSHPLLFSLSGRALVFFSSLDNVIYDDKPGPDRERR